MFLFCFHPWLYILNVQFFWLEAADVFRFATYLFPITASKVSKYWVNSSPYYPLFSPNTGKYRPEATLYLTLFTQSLLKICLLFWQILITCLKCSRTLFLLFSYSKKMHWKQSYGERLLLEGGVV